MVHIYFIDGQKGNSELAGTYILDNGHLSQLLG